MSETYRDYVRCWAKDIGRTIDYLETRDDIAADKVSYYGLSWGAAVGAIFPAVEDRIKVSVLYGGAFYYEHSRPEADQINFVPHVNIPVLMLNGEFESTLHFEESQEPMFNLFGTPPENKKHVLIKGGHLPKEKISQETLNWLDHYLGPVKLNTEK